MSVVQVCRVCGEIRACFEVEPSYWICAECENSCTPTGTEEAELQPCDPTPADVKTFIAAKLQAAADEVQQAVRAIRSLPSLAEHERPLSNARRDILGVKTFIDPTHGD